MNELTVVVRNIVLTLSSAGTAIIAYFGLKTWKKELKGTSEYELAKELLKAVYKVRNAFDHVRSPAIFSYEYPEEMLDDQGDLKNEKQYEGAKHVYENRYEELIESFKELEKKILDAQVEWGDEFEELIVPLRQKRGELKRAIQNHLERKKDDSDQEYDPDARFSMIELHKIIYKGEEDSEFEQQLNSAIEDFEEALRPYIEK